MIAITWSNFTYLQLNQIDSRTTKWLYEGSVLSFWGKVEISMMYEIAINHTDTHTHTMFV